MADAVQHAYEREDGKVTIVLADDHAVVRSGLKMVLGQEADLEVVAEAGDIEARAAACADTTGRCSCSTSTCRVDRASTRSRRSARSRRTPRSSS